MASLPPPPVLAALALTVALPLNVAFAEDSKDEIESVVLPAETNAGSLDYLTLADYFVTAERIPTHRMDTPANVTVITAEEIENNHYQSLAEVFNHVNGVVADATVQLNGTMRVLVLVDGRRIANTQRLVNSYKSQIGGIPSLKMIERIEIVKGGYSALYGSDAVGGVVNIITKKGTYNETTADINTYSGNNYAYEITNQGVKGNFSWFITGARKESDYEKNIRYSHVGNSWDSNSNYRSIREVYKSYLLDSDSASVRLDNKLDDRSSLTLQFLHKSFGYSGGLANDFAVFYNFKEDTATPGRFTYFYNHDSYAESSAMDGFSAEFGKSKFQGIEYQNGWDFGRHKLIAGLEWHRTALSTNYSGVVYDDHVDEDAAYVQDTFIWNKWNFVPGVRVDYNKNIGSQWSPKLAVNYRPDYNTKLFATWGRVFNSPSDLQLHGKMDPDYLFLGFTFNQYGNPNLRAEAGYTEMIGVEHDFNENIGISANYFKSKVDDVIGWEHVNVNDDIIEETTYNDETEKYHGIEINFHHKLSDKWNYNFGYTHTSGLRLVYPHDEDFVLDYNQSYPPNGYVLGVHYNCGDWKANLFSIAAEGFPYGPSLKLPSKFVIFDFNASYDINNALTAYFRATNFTNQEYSQMVSTSSASPARSFTIGAIYKF